MLGIYCIGNHPVLGVHVMGDVVSVREKSALITYDGMLNTHTPFKYTL